MSTANGQSFTWTSLTSVGMLMVVIVGAFWALAFGPIQDKFGALERRLVAREEQDIRFQQGLDARRQEFPTQFEMRQFENRMTDRLMMLEKHIGFLEQMRPTTGELSATSKNADAQITKLEERIRSLEIYVRQK